MPSETPTSPGVASDGEHRSLTERLDDLLLRVDRWRSRPGVVVVGVAILLTIAGGAWWLGRPATVRPVEELIPQVRLETTEAPTGRADPVVVHVAGAVAAPGVYTLDHDARVLDALVAAGGAEAGADLDQLNLAALVVDGIQIRVPVEGEVLASAPRSVGGATIAGPVDVNRATADQLESLPGIGPTTAAAIVAWRQEHGPFGSVDGLLDVPGIGPAKLAGLADLAVAR